MSTIYEIIMATARCYTKSGSVEKYESNLWKSPISGNWSSMSIIGTITTPDSNGNYTVTASNNFVDSDTTTSYYCFTEYAGVKKTFYFKKGIVSISIRIHISVIGYPDYAGKVVFNCYIEDENDRIKSILRDNSIILTYRVVNTDGPVGGYSTRVTSGMTLLSPGITHVMGKMYYVEGNSSVNPSSGKTSDYEWSVSTVTET